MIEDTEETEESLAEAKVSERTVKAVVGLTMTENPPNSHHATIRTVQVAMMVKTAELVSNPPPERVAQLNHPPRVRLAARLDHALEQLGVEPSVITALHASRGNR